MFCYPEAYYSNTSLHKGGLNVVAFALKELLHNVLCTYDHNISWKQTLRYQRDMKWHTSEKLKEPIINHPTESRKRNWSNINFFATDYTDLHGLEYKAFVF